MYSGHYYWGLIIPLMIISPFLFYVLPGKETAQKIGTISILNFVFGVLLSGWIGGIFSAALATYINTPNTVTYNWTNPSLWLEGQHWYGSFAFGLIYILEFSNFTKTKFGLQFLDSSVLVICLLYSFGKVACFLAGHNAGCSGALSDLPWAVVLPYKNYTVHSRQIYDAIFHLLLFGSLLFSHKVAKTSPSTLFFAFCITHIVYSILSDFLSENPKLILGLTLGQVTFVANLSYAIYYFKYPIIAINRHQKAKNRC